MSLRNKVVCFMISGKAGVGKTTSAKILNATMNQDKVVCQLCSFASDLKRIARMMEWDGEKDSKGRKLLQDLGKIGRDYNIDIWAKKLFDRVKYDNVFLPEAITVDDWRFPNELNYLVEKENLMFLPVTIRIDAPEREILTGTNLDCDISENSLPIDNENKYYNYFINNSGSFEDLTIILNQIYSEVKNGA